MAQYNRAIRLPGFFFFNAPATTEIYTLSLHDALPICFAPKCRRIRRSSHRYPWPSRSEEHTSELQSPYDLVCRLLLEKKNDILPSLVAQLVTQRRILAQL